jgi:hypothetical protein
MWRRLKFQMRRGNVLSTATFSANGLLSAHTTGGSSAFYIFDPGGSICQSLISTGAINYTSLLTAYGNATGSGSELYDGAGERVFVSASEFLATLSATFDGLTQ